MYQSHKSPNSQDEDVEPVLKKQIKKESDLIENFKTKQIDNEIQAIDFYPKQGILQQPDRKQSRVINLRKFQNWVKAVLIREFSKKHQSNFQQDEYLNILDLGCGRGGDLEKWRNQKLGLYAGVDISGESLQQALERYEKGKQRYDFKIHLLQASANMNSNQFNEKLDKNLNFDIVSMQFMANLLFSSEQEVNYMFENITSRLGNQGFVLLTITDEKVLMKEIQKKGVEAENGCFIYSNSYFSIQFDKLKFKDPYGNSYGFYLEDSVGEKDAQTNKITYVREYLIEMKEFQSKAQKYNLEIIENQNFKEFYDKYNRRNQFLSKKILGIDWQLSKEEWEIINLYRVVVLKFNSGIPLTQIKRKLELTEVPKTQLILDK